MQKVKKIIKLFGKVQTFLILGSQIAPAYSAINRFHSPISPYQFARSYKNETLARNRAKQKEFIQFESNFHLQGISYHESTGLTFDGHFINYDTGELEGSPKNWSAASKESLHIILLALALDGNKEAMQFICQKDPYRADETAIDPQGETTKRKQNGQQPHEQAHIIPRTLRLERRILRRKL